MRGPHLQPAVTRLVHSRAELAAALLGLSPQDRPARFSPQDRLSPRDRLGLVATMGALHAGHLALLQTARASCDAVIATIFVNPLQFGPGSDLDRYPRTLPADLEMCRQAEVDLVWAPGVSEVYPGGPGTVRVSAGSFSAELEGLDRPGHFDGVLTVVAKFFHLIRPDAAFFGEKDFQQLVLIRRMVADLDFGVRVVAVPTVRELDGLALSSRNVFLDPAERHQAGALWAALEAAASAAGGADEALAAARGVLHERQGTAVHYLALRGPGLEPQPMSGPARMLVAATVGNTRLIDNAPVDLRPVGNSPVGNASVNAGPDE